MRTPRSRKPRRAVAARRARARGLPPYPLTRGKRAEMPRWSTTAREPASAGGRRVAPLEAESLPAPPKVRPRHWSIRCGLRIHGRLTDALLARWIRPPRARAPLVACWLTAPNIEPPDRSATPPGAIASILPDVLLDKRNLQPCQQNSPRGGGDFSLRAARRLFLRALA
jgi:hypothetical protein